jgi:hypothetical protein
VPQYYSAPNPAAVLLRPLQDENKMFPKKDWEVCTDGQWLDDPLELEKLRQIHLSTHELALQFIEKEQQHKSKTVEQ